MDKPELPAAEARLVDAFGEFYWKEASRVMAIFSLEGSDSFLKTKDFFLEIWAKGNSISDWGTKIHDFPPAQSELTDAEKDLLWEEIYFEITEPMALAFRKKKAEFAKSMATFGKMLAATGFLAGLAYSLYLYGVKF